jgi:hypothetical protein
MAATSRPDAAYEVLKDQDTTEWGGLLRPHERRDRLIGLAADDRVAFAGALLDAGAVEDSDAAAHVLDQPGVRQLMRAERHRTLSFASI